MDVEPLPLREQLLGDQQAVRADDDDRCAEIESRLRPLGLQHGHAEPLGHDLRGRRRNPPPTALLRIGAGQQSRDLVTGRKPLEHVRTERRRRRDGDPGHRRLSPREDEPRPQLRHRLAPRLGIGAIDDQLAVEMVELVLDDAGRHTLRARG